MGQKLQGRDGISIVIGGDGELQEGSIWEVLQVIYSKNITNLVYVIDRNRAQNDDYVDNISPYYDLQNRFLSYGFQVEEINGHDFDEINTAFLNKKNDKCLIIIANTIKGKGIKRMEGKPSSHYAKISSIQAEKWKKQVTFQYEQHTLN